MKHLKLFEDIEKMYSLEDLSDEELEEKAKWLRIEMNEIKAELKAIDQILSNREPEVKEDEVYSNTYTHARRYLPTPVQNLLDVVNKEFNFDLDWIRYNATKKEIEISRDCYTENGSNRLSKIIKKTLTKPEFVNNFKLLEYEDEECITIKVEI